MKHAMKITVVLVILFFVAQLIGLRIIYNYIDSEKTAETGEVQWEPLPSIAGMQIDRPDVAPHVSLLYIFIAIVFGTVLLLLLIHFRGFTLWKLWFFLAVILCLHIAFGAFVPAMIALVAALVFGWWKVYRPNLYVHNATELFIYGGLAAIFVPILNIISGIVLLVLISGYDMYAVWKSKHMIKMAKFQVKSGMFAGLLIPYGVPGRIKKEAKARKVKKHIHTAILGGGDIGFPLIFAGIVLKSLGYMQGLVVAAVTALALFCLLYMGEKKKFYPAMPFLSAGCFVGYGLALLL